MQPGSESLLCRRTAARIGSLEHTYNVRFRSKDADTDEKLYSHEDLEKAYNEDFSAGYKAAVEALDSRLESVKRELDQKHEQKKEQFRRDRRAEIRQEVYKKLLQEIAEARAQAIALAKMTYYERFCRITQQNPFFMTAWIMVRFMDIIRTIFLTTFSLRFLTDVYSFLIATASDSNIIQN